MARVINFEGRKISVPEDASDEEVSQILSASSPAPAAPEKSLPSRLLSGYAEAQGATVEPVLKMATGLLAKPAGEIAGLAKGSYDAIRQMLGYGQQGPNAEEAQQAVQGALQYEPRTEAGASKWNPLNAIPAGIGAAIDMIRPDAVTGEEASSPQGWRTNAVREIIPQALGFLGVLGGPKAAASTGNVLKSGAESVMVNAINPTAKELVSGEGRFAAQELLKRGMNPNTKGVATVLKGIEDNNALVKAETSGSSLAVPKDPITDSIAPVKDRFMRSPNYEASMSALDKVKDEISNHPLYPGSGIPVPEAQMLKIRYQRAARPAYGEEATAAQEGYKNIAMALRKEIETAHPSTAPLNAESSTLHRIMDVIDRSAAASQKGPLVPHLSTLGGMEYQMAALINRNPWVRAQLAHGMDSVGNSLTGAPNPTLNAIITNALLEERK
jgi:hypothetical protein